MWYNCNRKFEALGIECTILAQWEGWVRMEPFLGCFHQSSKSLSWPRGAVTFSPHSDRLRVLRAAVGLSSLASHLLAASPSVAALDDSSHRLLLARSVVAALPAGPFASGIMQRAPNNPRAKSLNSVSKASCASAAIVVAVCEDGSPLASFEAKPRSEVPASIPADAGLSAVERKIAADEVASRALFL